MGQLSWGSCGSKALTLLWRWHPWFWRERKVVNRLFSLKYVLWPANISLNIGVFEESQRGVGGGGCCQFLGSPAPWLRLWCEEQGRALGGGRSRGGRGPRAGLSWQTGLMAAPGCDELLAGVCKHHSRISIAQPENQRCETNEVWWASSDTLTFWEDHVQPKLLKALLCLLKGKVCSLFSRIKSWKYQVA